jgi:hypothetical protein
MTKEEIQNVLVLVEAGARAISSQNPLDKAGAIMATAHELSVKLSKLADEAVET